MSTSFSTAISKGNNSYEVGKEVAEEALKKINSYDEILLSMVFASPRYNYKELIRGIREVTRRAPLIGCSTAGEFTETKVEKNSVACAIIAGDSHKVFTGLGKGLKNNEADAIKNAIERFPISVTDYPHLSSFLLIDGLTGKGDEITTAAANSLGSKTKISGGAAADALSLKETFVFCNDEVCTNAVSMSLLASKSPVSIGVKHGHSPISSNLTITKSKENIVYQVDGRPALDVWKDVSADAAKKAGINVYNLNDKNSIGSFLICYEAGLITGTNIKDYKVRVPLSANDDGSLNFACTMPEGSVIKIMQSPKENQITSAKIAAEMALKGMKGKKIAGTIVFDCVCRGLILGKDFYKGIDAVKSVIGNVPLIGFETYGEIAMEPGLFSGFHNTTTVVVLIPD